MGTARPIREGCVTGVKNGVADIATPELKFALENGIIDMSYVKAQVEIMRREKILKQHKYAITAGKDGYYYTYLPDPEKGRRLFKRRTREGIEDVVVEYYKKTANAPITFKEVYNEWRTYKDQMVEDNTIVRYKSDYKRYFEKSKFINMPISGLTEDDISVFIKNTITELSLPKKSTKTLFGYLHNTFLFACRHHYIDVDPMQFLEPKDFYQYCTESKRAKKEQIINTHDWEILQKQFQDDHRKNPAYIPTYAVELAALTGMRVGEISALTWDCVFDEYILINKSEKYNRNTKEYYISDTKNKKSRMFPVTPEIEKLLQQIKKVELQNGFLSEFVFSNKSGRIHVNVISSCIKNKCRQLGITEKGIHAYRKTLNSKMRRDGVSSTVAASLLGHSKEVNDAYYTFDVADLNMKKSIIGKINAEEAIVGA